MILIHFHKTSKIPPTFPHVLKYYRQEIPLVGTWYLVFQIKTVVYQTCTAPQSFGKICTHPSIQIQTSKGNITCLSKRYSNILNTLMRQMGGLFLDLFVICYIIDFTQINPGTTANFIFTFCFHLHISNIMYASLNQWHFPSLLACSNNPQLPNVQAFCASGQPSLLSPSTK